MKTAIDRLDAENPAYLAPYGLRQEPFLPKAGEAFYFPETGRSQRLNLLAHLVPYSALLLVSGGRGSGKSTLMARFCERAADTWRVCVIHGGAELDGDALLRKLVMGSRAKGDLELGGDTSMTRLHAQLAALRSHGLQPIVVIDDAHALSRSAWSIVFQLLELRDDNNGPLVSVVLFAEPQLADALSAAEIHSLKERASHAFELFPFSVEQTGEYIRHRLAAAGLVTGGPFTPAVVKRIHQASGGLPARINEAARDVLIAAAAHSAHEPRTAGNTGAGPKRRPIRAVAALVIVVGLGAAVYYQWQDASQGPSSPQLVHESVELPPPVATQLAEATAPEPADSPAPPADAEEPIAVAPPPMLPVDPQPPRPSPAPPADVTKEPVSPTPGRLAQVPSAVESRGAVVATAPSAPAVKPPSPPAAVRPVPPRPVEASTAQKPVEAPTNPLDAGARAVRSVPSSGLRRSSWIMVQNAEQYTIQLVALKTPEALQQFADAHELQSDAAYFETGQGDEPLYGLAFGLYPERALAEQAAARLQARFPDVKPWIRKVGDVQAAIKLRELQGR